MLNDTDIRSSLDLFSNTSCCKCDGKTKILPAIGLKPVYDISARNNPLPWTEHWISSKGLQVAPQETEVESYIVGGIKQDVKKDTFSGFKL